MRSSPFDARFCETIAPAMADGVSELAERWRPDVIVHEDRELGSWVAAERLGIPHVTVQATAWRPRMTDIGNGPLNALRERYGLARDEGLAGLYGRLFLTTRPRSLRDGDAPIARDDRRAPADRGRPTGAEHGAGPGPVPARDGRPRVAITLGTVNYDQVAVLRALIDGAVAAGAHVVVALGADPASLGEVPRSVSVHAYVPMSELLPAADLVAFHGGSGTMLAALAAGTRCSSCRSRPTSPTTPTDASPRALRACWHPRPGRRRREDAVEAIVSGPDYGRRAREVADEVAAMPGPDAALDRIESIVGSAA